MCQAFLFRRVMMFIVLQPTEVVWLLVSFYSCLCLLKTNYVQFLYSSHRNWYICTRFPIFLGCVRTQQEMVRMLKDKENGV